MPLRQQLARWETEVARLNAEIARLDGVLADGSLFARDPSGAAALAKARSEAVTALANAEDQWLAAGAALEQGV